MRILLTALAASLAISACGGGEEGGFDWVDWDAGGDAWTTPPVGGGGGRHDVGVDTAETTSDECPPRQSDGVRYLAEDSATCRELDLDCRAGEVPFQSPCGCGCVDRELWCPDAFADDVVYVGGDPSGCTAAFSCLPGWTPFSDGCGCGCVQASASTCPAEKLDGIASAVVASAWTCAEVTICFDTAVDEAQSTSVATALPGVTCDNATIASCPPGTASSCGGQVGTVSSGAMASLCGLARSEPVTLVDCANP